MAASRILAEKVLSSLSVAIGTIELPQPGVLRIPAVLENLCGLVQRVHKTKVIGFCGWL